MQGDQPKAAELRAATTGGASYGSIPKLSDILGLFKTAPHGPAGRAWAVPGRPLLATQVLALLGTAFVCWYLVERGLPPPGRVSVLNGFWGVFLGVSGSILAFLAPASLRTLLLGCWLTLWFTAGFAQLRASAITDGIVLGGIIPYSDGNNFIREAFRLIGGGNLSDWGSRRPLADSYLAGLFYLTNGRLAASLFLAGVLNAVALSLAAAQVRKTMGAVAAVVWVWLMLAYCRRFIGETLSEQAGISFGALGAAFLLRAFAGDSLFCLLGGFFTLSLALNARAGAFFVLATMTLAVALRWRRSRVVRVTLGAAACALLAFLLNFGLLELTGSRHGHLMSNFAPTLYGTVFGGGWQRAASDIPNFNRMSESDQNAEIHRRVLNAIEAHPGIVWRSIVHTWSDFFLRSKAALGPFSFFRDPLTEDILLIVSGVGLLFALAMWNPLSPLIVATAVGIFLSIPFAPTPDADRMRAYAATMAMMFLLPCFALSGWRDWLRRISPKVVGPGSHELLSERNPLGNSLWLGCCAVPYLLIMLAIPLFARFIAPLSPVIRSKVVGPDVELTIDLKRAAWIELGPTGAPTGGDPRYIPAAFFQTSIFGTFRAFYPNQTAFLDSIARPGIVIISPAGTEYAFVVGEAKDLKGPTSEAIIRGRRFESDSYYSPSFVENTVEHSALVR